MIRNKTIDRDQLFARLDDIKSRTKSSIEISRRLIDQSFLRFKATHRNLYAVQRSQQRLNALPQTKNPSAPSDRPAFDQNMECREMLHAAAIEANSLCDHCEGVVLNNKAYRVRSQDGGLILLDMVVCYACNLEAKNLGLETHELNANGDQSGLVSPRDQALAPACS